MNLDFSNDEKEFRVEEKFEAKIRIWNTKSKLLVRF